MSDPQTPEPKKRGRPPKAKPVAAPPAPPPLPATVPITPPKKGAGPPKKAQAPQSQEQERLSQQVGQAEARRDLAAAEYARARTVATELALLQGDMEVASAWSSYLRATNNHTHALKWGELGSKHAARVSALRELKAADLLEALADRTQRENAIALKVNKIL